MDRIGERATWAVVLCSAALHLPAATAQPNAFHFPLVGATANKAHGVATDSYGDPLPEGAVARLGTRRFRHEDPAESLAFTADGKSLVGYTKSGVVIWDTSTGRERHCLPVSAPYGASGMDTSADGGTLAVTEYSAADDAAQVGLWDLQSGKRIRTLPLPKGEGALAQITHLSFSLDGKSLAVSRTNKGRAAVFDVSSGEVGAFLGGGGTVVYNLAISPDGSMLAAACAPAPTSGGRGGVQLWDIATGNLVRGIYGIPALSGESSIGSLAFSPDGKLLACSVRNQVFLFDLRVVAEPRRLEANAVGQITTLAFTRNGNTLIGGNPATGKVRVWEVETGKIVCGQDLAAVQAMALLSEPARVALGDTRGNVRIWDLKTGRQVSANYPGLDSPIHCLELSPDGGTVVCGGDSGQMVVWDMATKKLKRTLSEAASGLAFNPTGRQVAMISRNKRDGSATIRMWDAAVTKEMGAIDVPSRDNVVSARFSPDGKKFFTLGRMGIRHWDVATGKQEKQWPTPLEASRGSSVLTSEGRRVFAVLGDRDIGVFDAVLGRQRLLRRPEKGPVQEPSQFSSDRLWQILVRGSEDEVVLLLSASLDNRVLAASVGGPNPKVHLWEAMTGKEICCLRGYQERVAALAWSRGGRFVATGEQRGDPALVSMAQTVRVWDSVTGQELARFGEFKTNVRALAFSPDSSFLIGGLNDGTVLIWDVRSAYPKMAPAPALALNDLESLWSQLAGDDAGKGHQAIRALAGAPKDAVPFLRARLKPVDAAKIAKWIADVSSDKFALRQAALKHLAEAWEQSQGVMRRALTENLSLEAYRRLEQILTGLPNTPGPEAVRTIRAIMVLEKIGSAGAQAVLKTLARGAPGARNTEEANAALERLAQQNAHTP
jgi:WD40 repeat protein